ncbi:MFS transporter [Saccharopolyspora sp. K220]|uniref:MFS transporter n=1 Tax=Saccharopolyspora soli TaxID=2926618 RepID=UPI001F56E042|nr:MFS transporter [Saccharopolyspora soli]MCI2421337.1 MFS transporter [Saccharopolyspora soli]
MTATAVPLSSPRSTRRWWMLATIGVAQLMVSLDSTIMNVALPSIQDDLGFSDGVRSWILTAYALAFGSLLLGGGRLADRFGRRRVFFVGLIGFAVVSAIRGVAVDFGMLVAARAAQGVFAALLTPATLALVTTNFPHGPDRARAFGIYGAISGAGGAIGLVVGGALTEYLSWRPTMFVNVFFAIPAVIAAFMLIAADEDSRRVRLDPFGTLTVSLGLFALVYGLTNAGHDGLTAPLTIVLLASGVVLLVAFGLWQARASAPLLPLRVLVDRDRAGGLIVLFIGIAGLLAVILLSVYYVQGVLGWSVVRTGIAFLPEPAAMVLAGVFVGPRLVRRLGAKVVVPVGLVVAAAGILLLTRLDGTSDYAYDILPTLVLLGLGLGLSLPVAIGLATRGLRNDDAGVGSALVGTVQQVGGSIGVAVINAIATSGAAAYFATATTSRTAPIDAIVYGDVRAFAVVVALLVAAALVAGLLLRRRSREEEPAADSVQRERISM